MSNNKPKASKGETITLDKSGKKGFLSKGMKDTPPPKKLASKKK